jgi:hypothetical protein
MSDAVLRDRAEKIGVVGSIEVLAETDIAIGTMRPGF